MAERYTYYGRTYLVLAKFYDTDEGRKEANAFMLANPMACVLDVNPLNEAIIVSMDDKGTPA